MREPSQRKLARKIEQYRLPDSTVVKIYVKRAADDEPSKPLIIYFRCQIGTEWVTYRVILTEGLRAVLQAKGTSDDTVIQVCGRYVKHEISRGSRVDGTELEFGPLQEELFPAT